MTKDQMVKDFVEAVEKAREYCRGESCGNCKYKDYAYCVNAMAAEALYDAGYRKCEPPTAYGAKASLETPPKKRGAILFVEDDSVVLDALERRLKEVGSNAKIFTYRKGSQCPRLVETEE